MAAGNHDVTSQAEHEREHPAPRMEDTKTGVMEHGDEVLAREQERKLQSNRSSAGSEADGEVNSNAKEDEDAEMQDVENADDSNAEDSKDSLKDDENDNAKDGDGEADADADADEDKTLPKKSRRELPPHTVAILKGWMLSTEHFKHPYPTDEDKQMLLKKTGITMKQLTNWFTNARKRIWKPMMKREHSRQLQNVLEADRVRNPTAFAAPTLPAASQYGASILPPRQRVPFEPVATIAGLRDARGAFAATNNYGASMSGYPMHPVGVANPYDTRPMRSLSEGLAGIDDGVDALHLRKRGLDVIAEAADATQADKRFRSSALSSPVALKTLEHWVATHSYPTPTDADKLQLSRDTGLGVQQIETWFLERDSNRSMNLSMLQQSSRAAYSPGGPNRVAYVPRVPAYAQRQSIPVPGNPLFPSRSSTSRPSIPGPGNSQFPPPPGVARLDASAGYRRFSTASYESASSQPAYHSSTTQASDSYSTAQGVLPPALPITVPNSAALPSLPNRSFTPGPIIGQARDGRSHTLDMGQFADARRRTMNFQDILASTTAASLTRGSQGSSDHR